MTLRIPARAAVLAIALALSAQAAAAATPHPTRQPPSAQAAAQAATGAADRALPAGVRTAAGGGDTCYRPAASPAPRRGTVAYNAWLGRTFTEVLLNTRDRVEQVRLLRRVVALNYVQHNPLVGEGRQGLVDFLPVIGAAFPDACFVLRDVFATRDRVVTRWTWTGTLTGTPFLGVPARGQRVEFDAIDVWTVRGGKLYEHWDQFDWTRAIVQLGETTIPAPFVEVAGRPVDR